MQLLTVNGQDLLKAIQQPGYPNTLAPTDLDPVFAALLPYIKKNIDVKVESLIREISATSSGSNEDLSLPRKAFAIQVEGYAKDSLNTYLFKTKKWQNKVPVIPFMMKAVHFCITRDINHACAVNKINLFVCPACKEHYIREPLVELSEGLFCKCCDDYINSYNKEPSGSLFYQRLILAKKFVKHSKRGVRCPRCARFVPVSLKSNGMLLCPYPGCGVNCTQAYGYVHPKALFPAETVSFSINNKEQVSKEAVRSHIELVDIISDQGCFSSTDSCVEQLEIIQSTLSSLKEIISNQKVVQARSSINKIIMYDAILSTVEKYPVEMIGFLIKKNPVSDMPIYATIFQEFSKQMLELLPITKNRNGRTITIEDPLDRNLHLFTGVKSFVGEVDKGLCLRKPTVLWKDRTRAVETERTKSGLCCFMAKIKHIFDENGNDLMPYINFYSFVNVQFKDAGNKAFIYEGKKVLVEYYAIPAHYSMKSMAHLRRIIAKISARCIARKLV
jgi:hypothetical protein